MKLYNSVGPNPRVVRMFLAEKGVDLPIQQVDLRGGENRRPPYVTEVNPHGQCPALEMENGACLAEITVICEYLEEKFPTPPLIGTTPEERAETRMWTRRVDLNVCEPMGNGFRFAEGLKLFKDRVLTRPEMAEGYKAIAQDRLKWLDGQLAGRQFLAGDRFTLADVLLFCFVDFFPKVGQPLDPSMANIGAWYERVKKRPSAAATA